MPWLKILKKLKHEEAVLLIVPVIVVTVTWVLESLVIVFGNSEEPLESLAEVHE